MSRWVVLDVGETLIDETRVWSIWADMLGIPRLTFMAGFGSLIARGVEFRDIFEMFGFPDWRDRWEEHEALYRGFQEHDLYPDALPAMTALRAKGYRLAVIANQPASRSEQLRALGVDAEVIAMSAEMQLFKPDPAFFERTLELIGSPDPASVAYVGDRVENDVLPATAASSSSTPSATNSRAAGRSSTSRARRRSSTRMRQATRSSSSARCGARGTERSGRRLPARSCAGTPTSCASRERSAG